MQMQNTEMPAADATILDHAVQLTAAAVITVVDPTIDPAELEDVYPIVKKILAESFAQVYELGSTANLVSGDVVDAEFVEIVEIAE